MKILHVMAGGDVGGAERIYLDTILALSGDKDIEQAAVTRDVPYRISSLKEKNIPVYTASFNKWWWWTTSFILKKAIREFKPDIVKYWMGRAGTFAVTGNHVNVGWYGGYYDPKRRFAKCSYHLGMTPDICAHIISKGIDANHVGVFHTVCDLDMTAEPLNRADYNTPEDAPLLLSLGRLHVKKGFDILLKALIDIPTAYAWIAGEGPLRPELEKLIAELGIGERVRLLGWRNDREALLKTCDICVFPSRYEPFGNVTVEAWAMKKPLVVAAAQGPKAYVRNGENGVLVPIDDVNALRDGILSVINDTHLAARIVQGGWNDYNAHFSLPAFMKNAKAIYQKMLESNCEVNYK